MHRLRTLALLLSPIPLLAGCGSGDGVPREPLAGSVTFEGKPLDKGVISFVSATDPQATAGGVIEQGTYAIPREDGLPPGPYRVSIWSNRPTGRQVKDRDNPGTTVAEVKQVVPPRYNHATQLTADVQARGSNQFDYALSGSAPGGKLARNNPPSQGR